MIILDSNGREALTNFNTFTSSHLSLNLNNLGLGAETEANLRSRMTEYKQEFLSLNLSYNGFGRGTAEKLTRLCTIFALGLKSLDLSYNGLGYNHFVEISQFFVALPKALTMVNLLGNHFASISDL